MKHYKAPQETPPLEIGEISIFLAGSIDMGSAEDWQTKMTNDLVDFDNLIIYNPRRDDCSESY